MVVSPSFFLPPPFGVGTATATPMMARMASLVKCILNCGRMVKWGLNEGLEVEVEVGLGLGYEILRRLRKILFLLSLARSFLLQELRPKLMFNCGRSSNTLHALMEGYFGADTVSSLSIALSKGLNESQMVHI